MPCSLQKFGRTWTGFPYRARLRLLPRDFLDLFTYLHLSLDCVCLWIPLARATVYNTIAKLHLPSCEVVLVELEQQLAKVGILLPPFRAFASISIPGVSFLFPFNAIFESGLPVETRRPLREFNRLDYPGGGCRCSYPRTSAAMARVGEAAFHQSGRS